MSATPIENSVTAIGNKEQQWEAENPKTAVAANLATLAIPGLGWGGAATRATMYARAGLGAYKAQQALRVAEAGVEVAHAGRAVNAAGHEIPALLRSQGQATRIVNAEHVKEAGEAAEAAGKALSVAGRDARNATNLAAKTSVEPGFMIAADHLADSHRAESGGALDAPMAPGSAVHSIRQESNHDQSQQPLMMPMTPPAPSDPLRPLGGHSGDLRAVGGGSSETTFGHGLMGATGADSGPLFGSNDGQRPGPRVNYSPAPNEDAGGSAPSPGGRGADAKDSGPGIRGSR